jgi:hypothetical protein
MRPIALARVRLIGTGHNICGVSAQTFVASKYAVRGDQTQGVVDHMTLLDGGVILIERAKFESAMISAYNAIMTPAEDLSQDLLGAEYIAEREAKLAALKAEKEKAHLERNKEIVARNTDAAAVAAKKSGPKPKA